MTALELNPTVSRYIYTVPTAIALPNLDSVVKAEKNNAGLFSPLLNSSASRISAFNALVKSGYPAIGEMVMSGLNIVAG